MATVASTPEASMTPDASVNPEGRKNWCDQGYRSNEVGGQFGQSGRRAGTARNGTGDRGVGKVKRKRKQQYTPIGGGFGVGEASAYCSSEARNCNGALPTCKSGRHVFNHTQELDAHIILDQLRTHKAALIRNWFAKRPRFHSSSTPTYAS